MIPFWIKVLALGLALATLVAACHHRDGSLIEQGKEEQRIVDQAATDKLKKEAAEALDNAIKSKALVERTLNEAKNIQEVKDAKNTRTVADLTGRLAALGSVSNGRLFDPNQTSGCRDSSGSAPNPIATASESGRSDRAEAGGLLSEPLSRLLLQITREADEVNIAYIACRQDAFSIRQ